MRIEAIYRLLHTLDCANSNFIDEVRVSFTGYHLQ